MSRVSKTVHSNPISLEPWEQVPEVWSTQSKYFVWMRGQMRRAWSRHPVKNAYMHSHRVRAPLGRKTTKNPTGLVWGCKCEQCKELKRQSQCEVDHIEAAGSFKNWDDFSGWMIRLMHINFDSIRIVCKDCHRIISYAERMHISFDEAAICKQVIAFSKQGVTEQKKALLSYGYKAKEISNAVQRKQAYNKHVRKTL